MEQKHFVILGTIAVLALGAYVINSRKQASVVTPDQSANSAQVLSNLTNSTSTTMDSNLTAQNGDLVLVHYTGKLTDGKVFDSSVGRGEPFGFILGAHMVIPGWEKGILGMKVGEKKTLTIAPEDGYGAQGVVNPATGEAVIPPNATLVFDVEIMDIKRQ